MVSCRKPINVLVDFIMSVQEVVKMENREFRSMMRTAPHCTSEERQERKCLEVELAMEKGWAVST